MPVLEAVFWEFESPLGHQMIVSEYKVINATHDEFHKQVAELLNEGWQPQGGVSVIRSWYSNDPTTYYFQAFVR